MGWELELESGFECEKRAIYKEEKKREKGGGVAFKKLNYPYL